MSLLVLFKHPKYLAGATWDILRSNQISKNLYMVFCLCDIFITMYYALMFLRNVHISNALQNGAFSSGKLSLTDNTATSSNTTSKGGFSLYFLTAADNQLDQIMLNGC